MLESFCGLRKFCDGPEPWDAGIYSRQDAKNAKLKDFFLGGLCPSTQLSVVSLPFESLRAVSRFERSNHAFARDNPRLTGTQSAPCENLRVLRAFVVNPAFPITVP